MKRVFHIAGLLSLLALFAIGCAGPQRVAGAQRSPHYQAVSQRLDLGGELFFYADMEGDVQRGAEVLQGIWSDLYGRDIEAEGDDRASAKIDWVQLSRILGFSSVHALGMSSYRESNGMFLNRSYLHIPDGRKGLMQVSGHAPHAFDVLQLAPDTAALVGDIDLNLRAIVDVLKAFDAQSADGDERIYDALEKRLALPLALLKMTPDELVQRLDTRLMFVMKLDEMQKARWPDFAEPMARFHAVTVFDNLGVLLEPFWQRNPLPSLLRTYSKGDFDYIAFKRALMPELPYLRPVLARQRPTGRLFIATDEAFLAECLDGTTSIATAPEFLQASHNMPVDSGNSLLYVSPQYTRWVQAFLRSMPAGDSRVALMRRLGRLLLADTETASLSVSRNEPEGIYTVSRSATSLKTSALQTTLILPVMFGTMALFPLGNALEKPANDPGTPLEMHSEAGANVELCYWAAVRYFEAHGTLPQSVDWTPARLPSSVPYPGDPADWAHPTWRALDFGIHAPHLYQYAFDVHGEAFSCMARGDTDGDGIYTIIERRGFISSDGYVEEDGPLHMRAPQK
ncbi:MAG: hypothetical protein M0R76_09705 [Proteobacteria bacterium]|nr:hypothetical protein [Pseudomonadota bacterium]